MLSDWTTDYDGLALHDPFAGLACLTAPDPEADDPIVVNIKALVPHLPFLEGSLSGVLDGLGPEDLLRGIRAYATEYLKRQRQARAAAAPPEPGRPRRRSDG